MHDPEQREPTDLEKVASIASYERGAKDMRSIASEKMREMSLKERLFKLANDFAVAKQGDIAVKLHAIHNSINPIP